MVNLSDPAVVARLERYFNDRNPATYYDLKGSERRYVSNLSKSDFGRTAEEFKKRQESIVPNQSTAVSTKIPTKTEVALNQSLPENIRNLSPSQVAASQSFATANIPGLSSASGSAKLSKIEARSITSQGRENLLAQQQNTISLSQAQAQQLRSKVQQGKLQDVNITGKGINTFNTRVSGKLKKIGITDKRVKTFSKIASYTSPVSFISSKAQRFVEGGVSETLLDIRDQPAQNLILVGIGGATGGVLKGTGLAAERLFGAEIAGKVIPVGEKVLGAAGGAGLIFEGGRTVVRASKAETPEEAGGIVGNELKNLALFGAGFKASEVAANKAVDIRRTFGSQAVDKELIVAPEFFEGQKYPQIKRGQSAGELQKEFLKEIPEIGETPGKPRAFTAGSRDFASKTLTEEGTSEVPGLFGAPRLSATFLRTSKSGYGGTPFGSEGLISTSKPTALRLELNTLELAPGVKASQRNLGTYNKEFFESIKGTGRSALPFAKTEKEVVTAAGTPISLVKDDFFFRINGRRVPIKEFKIDLEAPTKIPNFKGKTRTTVESEISSYGKSVERSIANPLASLGSSYRSSSASRRLSSTGLSSSSKSTSSSKSIGSSKSSTIPSRLSSRSSLRSLSSSGFELVSKGKSSGGSISSSVSKRSNRKNNFDFFLGKGKIKPLAESKKFEDVLIFTPDFTSKQLGITRKFKKGEIANLAREAGLGLREIPVFMK